MAGDVKEKRIVTMKLGRNMNKIEELSFYHWVSPFTREHTRPSNCTDIAEAMGLSFVEAFFFSQASFHR